MNKTCLSLLAMALLTACAESRKVAYLQNVETAMVDTLLRATLSEAVFTPGDILTITVTSSTPKAVAVFNNLSPSDEGRQSSPPQSPTYLVDSNGEINFPLVGKLQVAGLTRSEAELLIANAIYPRYITEKPSVSIHIDNFKISVMGEVKNPGIYPVPGERISVLEAIAMAGDLTITGRRDNVMLIRRLGDGSQQISRLNLNDASLLSSPHYYLQQNDVIYIEPNKSKTCTARLISPVATITVSTLSLLATIANLIVTISRE